jgi:hypothetical protein
MVGVQLFGAAVQEADMRVDPLNDLAVQFENEAKDAVGRGVLRSKVDGEIADRGFHRCDLLRRQRDGVKSGSLRVGGGPPATFVHRATYVSEGDATQCWRLLL